jgi:hypothetical protein
VPAEAVSSNVTPQWERSFNPAAVSRSLGTKPGVVLVVPAGPQSEDLDAAARVLQRTVQSGTEAERGLRAARVEGDDDQKVVRQAANQAQFDRALVVRLFEHEGELEAIVTLYDREGNTLGAFMARRGERMDGAVHVEQGVDSATLETIVEVVGEEDQPNSATEHELPPGLHQPSTTLDYETVDRNRRVGWTLLGLGIPLTAVGIGMHVTLGVVQSGRPLSERKAGIIGSTMVLVSGAVLSGVGIGFLSKARQDSLAQTRRPRVGIAASGRDFAVTVGGRF